MNEKVSDQFMQRRLTGLERRNALRIMKMLLLACVPRLQPTQIPYHSFLWFVQALSTVVTHGALVQYVEEGMSLVTVRDCTWHDTCFSPDASPLVTKQFWRPALKAKVSTQRDPFQRIKNGTWKACWCADENSIKQLLPQFDSMFLDLLYFRAFGGYMPVPIMTAIGTCSTVQDIDLRMSLVRFLIEEDTRQLLMLEEAFERFGRTSERTILGVTIQCVDYPFEFLVDLVQKGARLHPVEYLYFQQNKKTRKVVSDLERWTAHESCVQLTVLAKDCGENYL